MDALQFDSYTSYSDASTPRTPSPRTSICSDDMQSFHSPPNYKSSIDLHVPRNIFEHPGDEHGIVPESHTLESAHMWTAPYPGSYHPGPGSRGSLLEELYDHDIDHSMSHDVYDHPQSHHQAEPVYQHAGWSHPEQHIPQHSMRHMHDVTMTRRATFPYVRQDRGDAMYAPSPPFMSDHDSLGGSPYGSRPGTMYSEPLPMDGSPHMMGEQLHHGLDPEPFAHSVSMHSSPHIGYHDFHHPLDIKTEDAPVMVPSQAYCRPTSAGMHPLPCLSPHAGLLVQHTDDAASKETQYLRRRCFNCHTTEPPSWRRSTLNPGKIVCNKCGLYERTHLRPRPLRFDELRAGSKTRKQPKVGGSPKAGKMTQMVKKEPGEGESPMMPRRSSVSSSASSVHSASSDWDDNVSAYSGSSAPPSSFNSPAASTFPIPRDPNSQSPPLPRDGGIRLPNAPLSDIASLQHPSTLPSPPMPRKSATAPTPFYSQQQQQAELYSRRGSLPPDMQRQNGPSPLDVPLPEVTGWQSVPLSDLSTKPLVKSRSNSLRSVA
ncbi:hypothetical protein CERSUDRAFT_80180 [Gelatoporia subvermispora B]|uniref:GATA-type domain-containing protein n=1 Tax=Ceriporiopsis subvermispora (strain B) TaxID=914234 RepID=M2QTX4_CERS8|nr:hypothetical protein CERSUDRAFT_80180 [Gelatoporia subvermispora B]